MAQLFIYDHALTDDEILKLRAKRFLAQSPELRVKQAFYLMSITRKLSQENQNRMADHSRVKIKNLQ